MDGIERREFSLLEFDDTPDLTDTAAYLRRLEKAESEHQLDKTAFLDELGRAAMACEAEEKIHTRSAVDYLLARCLYLAEAHRRTVIRKGSNNARAGFGFRGWVMKQGMNAKVCETLVCIGLAADPVLALNDYRKRTRASANRYARKLRARAKVTQANSTPVDRAYEMWAAFTPGQRMQFLNKILDHDSGATARIVLPLLIQQEAIPASPVEVYLGGEAPLGGFLSCRVEARQSETGVPGGR